MKNLFEDTRFAGHGSYILHATHELLESEPILKQTLPAPITIGRARELLKMFLRCYLSTHSGKGSTLWVLVEYCKHAKIEYCIIGTPSEGYIIEFANS